MEYDLKDYPDADELMVKTYDAMIDELKKQRQEVLDRQEAPTGNSAEMFQQLGERVREEAEYRKRLSAYTRLRDEALGMSSTIKDYLNPKPTVSKFDVDAGKVKEDNSLNPLGGKKL